jgi:16S rRNA (uracil1498-N3)-methyltransferase
MTIRLFVETPLATGLDLPLPPGPARHAQVRRVQPGESLVLFNGRGGEWLAVVVSMGRSEVRAVSYTHLRAHETM